MNKKVKYILLGVTVLLIGITAFIYQTLVNYGEISVKKTEEIMDNQQKWMEQVISNADTVSYQSKRKIDSITKAELKILKKRDSLLKSENKNIEN
ncbi:MAG: hypothetical protein ACKVIG_12560 [Flavobacteriales bacterium]